MKQLLLLAGLTLGFTATITTNLNAYDAPFNVGCEEIYELGQEKLSIQDRLLSMAEGQVGVEGKDLYYWADVAHNDFNVLKDAFNACQADKPFKLNENSLDTFDRVEVEIAKLKAKGLL